MLVAVEKVKMIEEDEDDSDTVLGETKFGTGHPRQPKSRKSENPVYSIKPATLLKLAVVRVMREKYST
jgi:hypothetical protein